jgi:hypothetical protein
MQQLITGLLFVVEIPLNMFRTSLCPSSGAYQLQQQPPLVYRRNVVVAVLLVVVSPDRTGHLNFEFFLARSKRFPVVVGDNGRNLVMSL